MSNNMMKSEASYSHKLFNNAGIKFNVDSDLELWRAETLLTKEPETIAWLNYYTSKGGTFYDVGANIGVYSLYAAIKNPQLSVYAFEPVKNNFISLLNNKKLNKTNNLYPFNIALSNKDEVSQIYIKDERVGNSGAQLNQPEDEFGTIFKPLDVEHVLSTSIDNLIRNFSFPQVNFIKIDVDGHEGKIIEGMTMLLKKVSLKSVLVEMNSSDELKQFTDIFRGFGLIADERFNNFPNHSSLRRKKKKSAAVNMVFSKIEGN
jgi:FkbM family methyltransferase